MSKTKSLEELSAIVSECLPDVREYGKNREKRENRKNRKSEHEKTLQDIFLETLCENEIPICVFLVSGIKLQGYLDNFDQKILVLKNSLVQTIAGQMIYKRAIATIMPFYPVELSVQQEPNKIVSIEIEQALEIKTGAANAEGQKGRRAEEQKNRKTEEATIIKKHNCDESNAKVSIVALSFCWFLVTVVLGYNFRCITSYEAVIKVFLRTDEKKTY